MEFGIRLVLTIAIVLLFFVVIVWMLGLAGIYIPHSILVLLGVIVVCLTLLYSFRGRSWSL